MLKCEQHNSYNGYEQNMLLQWQQKYEKTSKGNRKKTYKHRHEK